MSQSGPARTGPRRLGIVGWLMRWAKMSVAMSGGVGNDFVFVVWCLMCAHEEVNFE
jgi:hypothetical protein